MYGNVTWTGLLRQSCEQNWGLWHGKASCLTLACSLFWSTMADRMFLWFSAAQGSSAISSYTIWQTYPLTLWSEANSSAQPSLKLCTQLKCHMWGQQMPKKGWWDFWVGVWLPPAVYFQKCSQKPEVFGPCCTGRCWDCCCTLSVCISQPGRSSGSPVALTEGKE